jgi:predicted lipoprotein with Yx(FWY)xxD motif
MAAVTKLMGRGFIPPVVHGVLDYPLAAILIVGPLVLWKRLCRTQAGPPTGVPERAARRAMTAARQQRNIWPMTRIKPHLILAGPSVIALVALAIAGCGGDDDSGQATAATPPKTSNGHAATVGVATNGSLGKILIDSQGNTVYLFGKDTGSTSTCSGACATNWPPVTAKGKPTAGTGLTASMLGTSKRSDGSEQVTYNGHPLYRYSGDQSPGDANGQGITAFGGIWNVVSPAGTAVTTSGSSGGNGNGY